LLSEEGGWDDPVSKDKVVLPVQDVESIKLSAVSRQLVQVF
jgi:hypothetical protein